MEYLNTLCNGSLSSRVLVVGAGGIGCELVKNLVLTGVCNIDLIDLDTIDVSNLNRQFLFQRKHVGKSKAEVAKQSALKFNPRANITARHASVFDSEYNVDFFSQFSLVMNALDNRTARNHVNRMCLAANIPLIESGTEGYLGQITVIIKGKSECYECLPKATQKTFPGCTIRNTPSEPIHCIVWAKHLFAQLFGEYDADQEVAPDAHDPELQVTDPECNTTSANGIEPSAPPARVSTRDWVGSIGYDGTQLFNKLFSEDIKYLLSMDRLWQKRRSPVPLSWEDLRDLPSNSDTPQSTQGLEEQRVWSIKECGDVFVTCVSKLKQLMEKDGDLVWDKDDPAALDFVTATANIRSHIFAIQQKSRFDVKSMAGNIIPAIASTNAIVAGLIVMEALKVLQGETDRCRATFLLRKPSCKKLFSSLSLPVPNPNCYVCSSQPEATIKVNANSFLLKTLEEKVLKERFSMIAPDVEIDDGKGTILISSEEGETEENMAWPLAHFNIGNNDRLKCDDFMQNFQLVLIILHTEEGDMDPASFEVVGDVPKPEPEPSNNSTMEIVTVNQIGKQKRRRADSEGGEGEVCELDSKRAKVSVVSDGSEDECIAY
ncbi:SUMO-activating enzyme subunit 2 [Oopsacas minuta]|uniref:SUMO-activating enzyme subunit n=1 Tax=Oopsacas minuta TaxID=111878 RepID=A0AAV7JDA9_9METZ|nr:SUMO-activating enzyme subunit 2 [Oopsacas minuta]